MFEAATIAVLAALTLAVGRALRGPTVFDRLLAANSVGTGAILLLSLFGFLTDRPEFLDLGLTYVLLNAIGTFAVLKFFRHGSLGHAGSDEEQTKVL
jgi:multicomponent Na+:H+ antiporter subunit F